jgi:CRISPR-associated protein Cmr5
MRHIDHLIPIAVKAIEDNRIPEGDQLVVPNEYKGYIDTFGASIVQNGLIPAVVFFEYSSSGDPDKADVGDNRKKLLGAVLQVIKQRGSGDSSSAVRRDSLYLYITTALESKEKDLKALRREVTDAALAVKLALRTFAFSKDEESNG